MGTGPVKGFGVTLTIGVVVSMFTALVVTRLIFDWLLDEELAQEPEDAAHHPATRSSTSCAGPAGLHPFVAAHPRRHRLRTYSCAARTCSGVEFAGGDTVTLAFVRPKPSSVDKICATRRQGSAAGDRAGSVSKGHGDGTRRTLQVTVTPTCGRKAHGVNRRGQKVVTRLAKDFPEAQFHRLSPNAVGPTVGAGNPKRRDDLRARCRCSASWFTWPSAMNSRFAVGAVVAVIHDVLMTMGCYFLGRGREFNATTVAAVLTIIGFSINDTIVIFDRIREDLKLGVRGTFSDVINQALNQTLSRTIITSGTVFLATLVALHLRRRADQRLRLHVPGRHPHRHLFEHLHRQRAGAVVAQGRAAAHWFPGSALQNNQYAEPLGPGCRGLRSCRHAC